MKRFKHLSLVAISVVCLIGFLGFNCLTPSNAEAAAKEKKAAKQATMKKKEPASVVVAATPVVKLAKKVTVAFLGSGFEPEKEIRLLFTDEDGMQTDIGYALQPEPKTNKGGAFATNWVVDEFIKAQLVKEGVFTVTVTDAQFNPLAITPISFEKAKEKDDKAKGEKGEKGEKKEKGEKGEKKEKGEKSEKKEKKE